MVFFESVLLGQLQVVSKAGGGPNAPLLLPDSFFFLHPDCISQAELLELSITQASMVGFQLKWCCTNEGAKAHSLIRRSVSAPFFPLNSCSSSKKKQHLQFFFEDSVAHFVIFFLVFWRFFCSSFFF